MGSIHEDQYTILISGSVLFIMRNVSDQSCRHHQNIFYIQKCDVYEITWKNTIKRGRTR